MFGDKKLLNNAYLTLLMHFTNSLDTLRALESYLEEFKGVLVIVSHDRSFTDQVRSS